MPGSSEYRERHSRTVPGIDHHIMTMMMNNDDDYDDSNNEDEDGH